MKFPTSNCTFRSAILTAVALIVFVASCSGSSTGDNAVEVETSTAIATEPAEPTAAPTPTAAPSQTEITSDTAQGTDRDLSTTEMQALLTMTSQFGFAEPEQTAVCMHDTILDGGVSVEDALTTRANASITAAVSCGVEPGQIFTPPSAVGSGGNLSQDQINCAFDAMIGVYRDTPMTEATSDFPVIAVSDAMEETCGLSAEEIAQLLG